MNILKSRKEISRYKISEKIIYTKTEKDRPEEKTGIGGKEMRISELLSLQAIDLNTKAASKAEVIDYMTRLMEKAGNLNDREAYKKGVLAREEEGTTGIGEGIAIPHAKSAAVKKAESPEQFISIIDEKDDELDGKKAKDAAEMAAKGYRVLAITACPTGIAHTFMAAESLENKGKEMGIPVKAETQGADGAKNVLTAEEIKNAECIIIAADKNVDLSRFDGKPVISVKVADGIHKAQQLIDEAVSGNVPLYHHSGAAAAAEASVENESVGRKIYKDLMNGVSHMLPFVIGGGILIALAFLLDDYSIDPSNFGKNTPVAA